MNRIWSVVLLLAATLSGLVLAASATGTAASGVKVVRLHDPLEALAMIGSRVAYDIKGSKLPNRVLVWNLSTGTTTKVSGKQTVGADSTVGIGVSQLAIAGTKVAWLIQTGGNEEGDDDLYSSSLLQPKERHVLGVVRSGGQCGAGEAGPTPACAGTWLGGVVGSGRKLLVNRWTTDTTGEITSGGLYELNGTRFKAFANGSAAVQAVAADSKRIAVLQWRWYYPARSINVISATGTPLSTVTPTARPKAVVLSGRNLLVLEPKGKLALYDAGNGSLRKTFTLHGNENQLQALAVHGNIAVYSTPVRYFNGGAPRESVIRALNLKNGKDRPVGKLAGQIPLARIDSTGLVYANEFWLPSKGYLDKLVFLPFKQLVATVS
jgi:hypothetical protein